MTAQHTPPACDIHNLKCLEVWGGSNIADHAASVPGLDITVSSRPVDGAESGGDLYLISSCSSGWISRILLADVAGHGLAVSDLSHKLRKAMHKHLNTVDQSKLARTLNSTFQDFSDGSKFATALLMTYFAPTGHLILVNAGHPLPLLRRNGATEWHPIDQNTPGVLTDPTKELRVGIKNLPLGVIKSTQYEQIALKFNPGDRICAYTDAFTEAQHNSGKLLGTNGLADTLQRSHSADTNDHASSVLADFKEQGFEQADDDHTMLMISHNGAATPSVKPTTIANVIKDGLGLGHTDTYVTF